LIRNLIEINKIGDNMSKRRLITIDLFEDHYFGSLDNLARLTWIGLVVACADDQGRFIDNIAFIRSKIFPYDSDITNDQIESIISKFADDRKIIRYQTGNIKLIQINSWRDYQMISWSSESKYAPPMHWIDRTKKHPLK